jgi:hypothetical protein
MKICVIGNSHVAAIKSAWDDVSHDHPSHELYFFAAPGNNLRNLKIVDNYLAPTTEVLAQALAYTSGGKTQIELNNFDIFLIYGLGLRMPRLDVRLSKAVLNQACQDIVSNSLNFAICDLIRKLSKTNIYVFHNPQPARSDPSPELIKNKLRYSEVTKIISENLQISDAILLSQPEESLQDLWHTSPKFAIGSTRLLVKKQHPESEIIHMNKDFGILWLTKFFHEIDKRFSKTEY